MLLVLISFVALGNMILGGLAGTETLTIESILGFAFAPLAWLIGIPWEQAGLAGSLLGTKVVLNEVMAYVQFAASAIFFPTSADHALRFCGFANVTALVF